MVFKRLVVHFDDICEYCCATLNARKVVPADCVYGVFDLPPLMDTLIKKKPLKDGERGPLLHWGGKYGTAFGVANKTSHSPPPWQIFSGTFVHLR